ncbi:MAG: hypothetical protein LBQ88_07970 [Treponema sp.]|jgi:hypothetical protein|nr:hypothetical protein [Treponema sp.]
MAGTAVFAQQISRADFEITDGVLVRYSGNAATPAIPADWGISAIGKGAFYSIAAF